MRKQILFTFLLFLISMVIFADARSEEIIKKNKALKKPADEYSISLMVIIDKNQEKKTRKIEMYSREGKEGKDTFMAFLDPPEVKGTKFLTIAHNDEDDEQRLYLPAFGKIRRISASKKGSRFMGSDLYFYDLEDHSFNDFTYQHVKDGLFEEKECWIIDQFPRDKEAPYSKVRVWIGKDDYYQYKAECYDKKREDELIKTISIPEVNIIDGIIKTSRMAVENHKYNSLTLIQFTDIKLNIDLDNDIFTVKNLEND
ncbi:MAG: outer membrane lipoprotein-sorting protein [Spirochaetales bacterium]|nr:outer membrane lipoprotein-sorting protein [Spirochaetales bacterium]